MLFNSYEFIFFFLPITFFIYFYLNKKRLTEASKAFLVFSSLFFYSWWNISYLPIILVSMLFNYVLGVSLSKNSAHKRIHKKTLLTFGIIANIALLGYFKYADFLLSNLNVLTGSKLPLLHLALPLAISFFTFQQIAYLVDSYRGETKEYDFLNYANFVTFFPQLIAGPIVHHAEMMPQFAKTKNNIKDYKNIALGFFIFAIGLFKKVVIADTFSVWASRGFDTIPVLNFFEAWATSLSYTFQLYFDFSGYTDMAIGAALLFNIKLPINFNSPYKATSIQDFWRRWHITLSRFLKDYIYIPLGGNRKGELRTYTNLFSTFLLGGIWHGAGWTFVLWGALHGMALIIHRIWKKLGFHMPSLLAWIITFNFINAAWVFFRAKEWNDAIKVFKGMTDFQNINIEKQLLPLYDQINPLAQFININNDKFNAIINIFTLEMLFFAFVITVGLKNSNELSYRFNTFKAVPPSWFIFTALLLASSFTIMSIQSGSEFLYFNF